MAASFCVKLPLATTPRWSSWQIASPTEGTLPIDLYLVDLADPAAPVRLHWIVSKGEKGTLSVTAEK